MPPTLDPVTQHHVDQAADRLAEEFVGVFSQETIARYIAESLDMLEGARINVFVPVLAHRFARERLSALAQTEGIVAKDQQEVLFVCVHNAGRIRRGVPETAAGEVVSAADVMITMGCGDACPIYPGRRYEDWDLDDSAGLEVDEVRRTRDDIAIGGYGCS